MDNSQYLKDLAAEEKRIKQVELDQQRAQALTQLEQEKAKVMPTFQQQRQQANVQSQIGAKNFAEYWANRGQTNAGINAQEQMSRANTLGNTMGGINQAQNQATLDFSNQALNTNTQFSNALQNSNATIDQNLNTNLYNERQRVQELNQPRTSGSGATVKPTAVNTQFWQGALNPNTKLGTFETLDANGVKYQPNNVGTYTYKDETGKTIKATNTLKAKKVDGKVVTVGQLYPGLKGNTGADVSNQKVWIDKQNRAWYWDGSINDYRRL